MRKANEKWEWTDGTSFDYSNWAKNKPDNNEGKQKCGLTYADKPTFVRWDLNHYTWDDVECDVPTRAAVCKKDGSILNM